MAVLNVGKDNFASSCYAVQCSKCGKTTWAGCGKHKDSVMAGVAEDQRCSCPREGEAREHVAVAYE